MEPIFETSVLGFRTRVFPDRISYRPLLGEKSIPISQIATVDDPLPGLQQVKIETAGGKVHSIPVRLRDKAAFIDAVLSQMAKAR